MPDQQSNIGTATAVARDRKPVDGLAPRNPAVNLSGNLRRATSGFSDLGAAQSLTVESLAPELEDGATEQRLDRVGAQPGTLAYLAEVCEDAAAILKRDNDEADAAIAATPIHSDLARVRAAVNQRKAQRFTVAEVNELDRLHAAVIDALGPHVQRSFSVPDLINALQDAGYEVEAEAGDVRLYFGIDDKTADRDRTQFIVQLALAAPRYAQAILDGATWLKTSNAYVWDVKEIARRAA